MSALQCSIQPYPVSHETTFTYLWLSLYLLALIPSLFVTSTPSQAQTPRIQGQGAAASGMGNAFAAQADDASAIHYNPAGMAQLSGVHTMLGTLFVGVTTNCCLELE